MINKEDIVVGTSFKCNVLFGKNSGPATITQIVQVINEQSVFYKRDNDKERSVTLSAMLNCTSCKIVQLPLAVPKKTRFELINESTEEEDLVTKHTNIQEQDSLVFEDSPANLNKSAEILNLKDQLFNKIKLQAKTVQAKKDMASSYRATLVEIKEQIDEIIGKIDSLEDKLKQPNKFG